MARTKPVRVAVVGAGAIGRVHVQAVQRTPLARLVAVVDKDEAAAGAVAAEAGCASFRSVDELLAGAGCDAAIICTPPFSHPGLSITLMEAGMAVLCEKPLAVDVDSALEMIEAADRHGVILTMASKFRYVDDVIEARRIARSGMIGEVVLFENAFTSRVPMAGRWNADPMLSGGGVLIDNGTHSIDIVRYVVGPITEVMAIEGRRIQGLAVEDTARVFLRTESGSQGMIELSWSVDRDLGTYLELYGSEGTVRVGWKSSQLHLAASDRWTSFGRGYDKMTAFVRQLENFCRALRGEEELVINPVDAIESVAVVEAAYRAMQQDLWVRLGAESSPVPASRRGAA